mmetsp:Transcript_3171/g.9246  ORF Transcript_3171/g.9246 Transcript_3171/m.9246 type:complete len:336 (-) Transcript_3171:426-1433(-)
MSRDGAGHFSILPSAVHVVTPSPSRDMASGSAGRSQVPFWWGSMSAFVSVFFFLLGFLLHLIQYAGVGGTVENPFLTDRESSFKRWTELDPAFLRQLWKYRASVADLHVATDFVLTIAFFLMAGAASSLSEVFDAHGHGHTAARNVFLPCFVFAAAMMVLDLTFNAGADTTAKFIAEMWNLDDATLKGFEVSYILSQSRGVWLFAMEWWFLGFGMVTGAYINSRSKMLSFKWTVCSLLIAVMCVCGFAAEIARLQNWVVASEVDIAVAILVGFVFLPVWLVWVGVHLKSLREEDKFSGAPIGVPPQDAEPAYGLNHEQHNAPEANPPRDAEMSHL